MFQTGQWVYLKNKRSGKTYQPFQYDELTSFNSKIYELNPWIPQYGDIVWLSTKIIPVYVYLVSSDDFFVTNKGISFEAQVYLKDLAPFSGDIPLWLSKAI